MTPRGTVRIRECDLGLVGMLSEAGESPLDILLIKCKGRGRPTGNHCIRVEKHLSFTHKKTTVSEGTAQLLRGEGWHFPASFTKHVFGMQARNDLIIF